MKSYLPFLASAHAARLALLACLTLVNPTTPAHAAPVQHVVQVSLDGLGALYLQDLLETEPENYPSFVRLINEGASTFNARCDYDFSETVPNHITMFTARPVLRPEGSPDTSHHGYDSNFPGFNDTIHEDGNPAVEYMASMFDVAHDYGLRTAFYAGKTRLEICRRSYDEFNGALDLIGEDNGTDKIDLALVANVSGIAIANQVDALLDDLNSETPAHYSFIHIAEPDITGHGNGWGTAAWNQAVQMVDTQLGRLLDAIQSQPNLAGQTAVIITADHGGGGVVPNGHTEAYHIANYTIPFFVWGPEVPAGVDLYSLLLNRGDPGTNRTDYTTPVQPIRDGDASNLALAMLGLPPIPDSFMIPSMSGAGAALTAALVNGMVEIQWDDPLGVYVLEQTSLLLPVGSWERVANGIQTDGFTSTFTAQPGAPMTEAFFRLRRLAFGIVSQPQDQTVHANTQTTLNVTVSGDGPFDYQWFKDGNPVEDADQATVSFDPITAGDAGEYYVTVTDGLDTLTSDTATLSLLFAPVIVQQPVSQVVTAGVDVTFSVVAEGAGTLAYQWHKDGEVLPDETSQALSLTDVAQQDQGNYSVTITDLNGSTVSEAANLAVLIPLSFVQQPVATSTTVGGTATFTVTVAGNPPPFTYAWRKFPTTPVFTDISSETTSTLTLTNVQSGDAGSYIVIVSGESIPNSITSFPVPLTVE